MTPLEIEYNAANGRVMLVESNSGRLALEISPGAIGQPSSQPLVEEMLQHRYPDGYQVPDGFADLFRPARDGYLVGIEVFAMARHEAEKRRR